MVKKIWDKKTMKIITKTVDEQATEPKKAETTSKANKATEPKK